MEKKIICIIIFISFVCIVMSGFGNRNYEQVEDLLNKRIDIIDNAKLGNISLAESKRQLNNIEEDFLLKEDIKIIQGKKDNENPRITSIKLLSVDETNNVAGIIGFEGEAAVTYANDHIVFTQKDYYNIGVKEDQKVMKLLYFEIHH